MSGFPINSSTLFLGDLSVNCNEESIYQLFSSYGEIEIIQLKRSDRDLQRVHLGYGFIKFTTTEAAERALQALNGYFFLGRSIRVGWAEDHESRTNRRLKGSPRQPNISDLRSADPKKNRQTAQIHVTFSSSDMSQRISELELGDIFSQFGNLVDIAIKKNVVSPDQRTQSGYGFIHFALSEEGIRSAVTAVERTNHQTCDRISFQSKVTHSLQAHIFALKHRTSQQPPPTSSYEPRQSPVPAFLPSTTTMRYDSSSLRFDSYQNRQRPPQSSYLSSYSEGPPTADRKHSFTESPFETYQSQLDSSYSSSNVNENSWKNDR